MTTNDWITLIISICALVSTIALTITQIRISKAANSLPVGIDLLREFRDIEFKKKANSAYDTLARTIDYSKLSYEQTLNIDYISHFYDSLGILVQKGIISKRLITSFMGENVSYAWGKINPYINYQRQKRNNNNYQIAFEYLADISSKNRNLNTRKKMGLKIKEPTHNN